MRNLLLAAILFLAPIVMYANNAAAGGVDDLKIYTEEYPPYNYSENGKATGIFTEVVDYLLKATNSTLTTDKIEVIPWARGYNLCLNEPNVALYSTTFTEERKPLFKWVGPVVTARVVLFAKKSRGLKISGPEDIAKYRIGVINEDIGEQLLKNLGIPKEQLDGVPKAESNIKKLATDRIDLMAYGEDVGKWFMKSAGENVDNYEAIYTLKEGEMYIALNKNTPDETVAALQKALDKLKTEDAAVLQAIKDKYLK